jgi:hypothetical protein
MTEPIRDSENTENLPPDDLSTPTEPIRDLPNDLHEDFQLVLDPISEQDSASDDPISPTDLLGPSDSAIQTEPITQEEHSYQTETTFSSESESKAEGFVIGKGFDASRIHRMQKNEPSFLRKVLPPILGGLAAFPIATAIMWYGLGKDIGSTGQYVGKYVPWIVPSKLRGGSFSSDGKFGGGKGSIAKSQPNKSARETTASESKPTWDEKPAPIEALPSVNTRPSNNNSEPEAPTTNRALPKLERSDSIEKIETKESTASSIRTTLEQIAELQREWNNTPKDREKQLEKLSAFYSACVQLAKQTGELRGNAIRAWQKDLDQFSSSVLSSPTFSKAIDLCSQGKVPSIATPSHGDCVILIESFSIDKELVGNQEFPSKLIADDIPLPLVLPESLIKQLKSPSESRKRILLGRIVDGEANSVILVHCCLE